MTHFKVTMNIQQLLDAGYPQFDYCEVSNGIVVRRVQTFSNGTSTRQSLEGADEFRKTKGLRESTPERAHTSSDGDFVVERIAASQFEDVWNTAEPSGEGWG